MSNLTVTNVNGQNDLEGRVKSWANFNGSGTVAFRDSFNMSSLIDNGTGDYSPNFTNNKASSDYSVAGTGSRTDATGPVGMSVTPRLLTTGGYRSPCEYNNGSREDFDNVFVSSYGDLA